MKPELHLYCIAKQCLINDGFKLEIDWQLHESFGSFSERDLLRETAWVILCGGFKEAVVRSRFDFISLCFCDWESAATICASANRCRATALAVFANERKIDAILGVAALVDSVGFDEIKKRMLSDPIRSAQMFPYIGPITSFHLAKNLGYPVAKPDRHLARLAARLGYSDVQQLCRTISTATGDPIQVVDVVLWRYTVVKGHWDSKQLGVTFDSTAGANPTLARS